MKILAAVVAAMLIVALTLLLLFNKPDSHPTGPGPEAVDSGSGSPEQVSARGVGSDPARQPVDSPGVQAEEEDVPESHAPLVASFEVKIIVVDATGEKVPWASVEVWPALRIRMGASRGGSRGGSRGRSQSGRSSQTGRDTSAGDWAYMGRLPGRDPILTLSTDAMGRCTFQVDRELSFLSVHKAGVGRSSDISLSPLVNKGERRIVLQAVSVLTGVVLQSTGEPKMEAKVKAILLGGPSGENLPSKVATQTDRLGRFRLELAARATYVVVAGEKSMRSDKMRIPPIPGGGEREIVLQLPGLYSLRGRVLDPEGRPVDAGSVVAWIRGLRESSMRRAPVLKGQFELPLISGGDYVVRAESDGFAFSKPHGLELSDAVRSAHLTLHLLALGVISGRVVGPDSKPIGAASLKAWRQMPGKKRIEGGRPLIATSAADGTFVFKGSHPAARYTVVCVPDPARPRLELRQPNLTGDSTGLELRLDQALLKGTRVVGRFVDGKTSQPIEKFEIQILHHHKNGAVSMRSPKGFESEKGQFTIDGLVIGETYSLKAKAEGRLITLSKTFQAGSDDHHVRLSSPIRCRVICRITCDDGRSVQNLTVRWVPAGSRRMVVPPISGKTDSTGSAEAQMAPGKYLLFVFPGGKGKKIKRSIEVRAGMTNAVDVSI